MLKKTNIRGIGMCITEKLNICQVRHRKILARDVRQLSEWENFPTKMYELLCWNMPISLPGYYMKGKWIEEYWNWIFLRDTNGKIVNGKLKIPFHISQQSYPCHTLFTVCVLFFQTFCPGSYHLCHTLFNSQLSACVILCQPRCLSRGLFVCLNTPSWTPWCLTCLSAS